MSYRVEIECGANISPISGEAVRAVQVFVLSGIRLLLRTTPPEKLSDAHSPLWHYIGHIKESEVNLGLPLRVQCWDWNKLDKSDFVGEGRILPEQFAQLGELPHGRSGGSRSVPEVKISISKSRVDMLQRSATQTALDYASLATQNDNRRSAKQFVPKLVYSLMHAEEMERKDVLCDVLAMLAQEEDLRLIMFENKDFVERVAAILSRGDYLAPHCLKLLFSLVHLPAHYKQPGRVEEVRQVICTAALPTFASIMASTVVDDSYLLALEILKQCSSNDVSLKTKIFDAGIAHSWVQRIASDTRNEGIFKAALLSLGQFETIKKKILRVAVTALRFYLELGWRETLDNDDLGEGCEATDAQDVNVYRSRLSPQAPSPRSHYTSSIAALSPIVSYNNENGAAGDTTAIRTKASNSGEGGFSGAPVHNRSRRKAVGESQAVTQSNEGSPIRKSTLSKQKTLRAKQGSDIFQRVSRELADEELTYGNELTREARKDRIRSTLYTISDGEIRPPVDAKVAQSAEAGDLETLQKIVQSAHEGGGGMYTFTDGTFGDPHFGITSPASSENSTYGEKKTDFGAQPVSPPIAKMEREIERMLSEESPRDDSYALHNRRGGVIYGQGTAASLSHSSNLAASSDDSNSSAVSGKGSLKRPPLPSFDKRESVLDSLGTPQSHSQPKIHLVGRRNLLNSREKSGETRDRSGDSGDYTKSETSGESSPYQRVTLGQHKDSISPSLSPRASSPVSVMAQNPLRYSARPMLLQTSTPGKAASLNSSFAVESATDLAPSIPSVKHAMSLPVNKRLHIGNTTPAPTGFRDSLSDEGALDAGGAIVVKNPIGLASIITAFEKERASKTIEVLVTRALGAIKVAVLPNLQNPLWKEPLDELPPPEGANDILVLSLLFAGTFPSALFHELSESQLSFYLPFFLKYKGRFDRNLMLVLQSEINNRSDLARQFYFLQRITKFNPSSPLLTWRSEPALFQTVRWFDTEIVASGKNKVKEGQTWTNLDIRDPIHVIEGSVTSAVVEKIYTSNAKPILIKLIGENRESLQIFKRGDDLRQDYAIQSMFFLFNRLWQQSAVKDKPSIHQYKIVPMGPKIGTIEFIPDCVAAGEYNWKNLNSQIDNPTKMSVEDKYEFITSMAGSYIACWVLGIRDRHQDNMMIHMNRTFFHIDFGFILNEQPGFDAPIFSLPRGVKKNLSTDEWNFFLKVCGDAFGVLHRNAGLIINACTDLLEDLPMFSVAQIRKYLVGSLMVNMSETSGKHKIRELILSGAESTKKEMKYLMHDIAQKMK